MNNDYIQLTIAGIMALTLIALIIQLYLLTKQINEQQDSNSKQMQLMSEEVKLLTKEMEYEYSWQRRSKALEYSLSRNKNLQEIRKTVDSLFENIHQKQRAIPYKEINSKLKDDKQSYTVITSLLAHWENLALAIHFDIVDEDVAFEMTAGLVIDYVKAFEDFIKERRKHNNPRAYNHLLDLSSRWNARLLSMGEGTQVFPRVGSK